MDNLTRGKNAETSVTFLGDDRHVCRVWTNDVTTVTRMERAGFKPDKQNEHGVQYIDVPTNRIFRPSKPFRKPSETEKAALVKRLAQSHKK